MNNETNKCLIGRGATTAVSQLQWSQSSERYVRNGKTNMRKLKKKKGNGQTRYVKRCMTDRLFSRIVGSLGRSYVVRHSRSTCTLN